MKGLGILKSISCKLTKLIDTIKDSTSSTTSPQDILDEHDETQLLLQEEVNKPEATEIPICITENEVVNIVHEKTGIPLSEQAGGLSLNRGAAIVDKFIEIEAGKEYPFSIDIENISTDTNRSEAYISIGVKSYDENYNEINTDLAGNINAGVTSYTTIYVGQSQSFSGTFKDFNTTTGTDPNKFDPTAKYFRFVIINYGNGSNFFIPLILKNITGIPTSSSTKKTGSIVKEFDKLGAEIVAKRKFYVKGVEVTEPIDWAEGACCCEVDNTDIVEAIQEEVSKPEKTEIPICIKGAKGVNVQLSGDFSNKIIPSNAPASTVAFDANQGGVLITKAHTITVDEFIQIEADKEYTVNVQFEQFIIDSYISIGVKSYDENYNEINTDGLPLNNGVANHIYSSVGQSHDLTGVFKNFNTITGTDPNKFDPTAKYFKVFIQSIPASTFSFQVADLLVKSININKQGTESGTGSIVKSFDKLGEEILANRKFYIKGVEVAEPADWYEGACTVETISTTRTPNLVESTVDGSTDAGVKSFAIAFKGAGGTLDGVTVEDGTSIPYTVIDPNDTLDSIPYTVPTGGSVLISYIR